MKLKIFVAVFAILAAAAYLRADKSSQSAPPEPGPPIQVGRTPTARALEAPEELTMDAATERRLFVETVERYEYESMTEGEDSELDTEM